MVPARRGRSGHRPARGRHPGGATCRAAAAPERARRVRIGTLVPLCIFPHSSKTVTTIITVWKRWTATLALDRFRGGRPRPRRGRHRHRRREPGRDPARTVDGRRGDARADRSRRQFGAACPRPGAVLLAAFWPVVHIRRRVTHEPAHEEARRAHHGIAPAHQDRANGVATPGSPGERRAARPSPTAGSVGVDQLADRGDLAAQLVVRARFAGDLVAGVEDRGVVPPAELGADPEE